MEIIFPLLEYALSTGSAARKMCPASQKIGISTPPTPLRSSSCPKSSQPYWSFRALILGDVTFWAMLFILLMTCTASSGKINNMHIQANYANNGATYVYLGSCDSEGVRELRVQWC